MFFLFQRVSITWLRQRESEKIVLYPQGGEEGIGPSRTWNSLEGLPSKYYPRPMLLNFSVPMGTGVSSMVNLLTSFYVVKMRLFYQVNNLVISRILWLILLSKTWLFSISSNIRQKIPKILGILNLCLFFSLALVVVEFIAILWFFTK